MTKPKSTPIQPLVLPLILWGLSLLIFVKHLSAKILVNDLWWHLASGREMMASFRFLREDVFSHTLLGQPWVNFEWLSQIFLYGLHQGGGLKLIFVVKIGIGLLVVGVLWALLRSLKVQGPWLLILTWVGFVNLRPRLLTRPELVTLLLIPIFIRILLAVKENPKKWFNKAPWILSGLTVFWVNTHGGFIYGIGLIVLFLAGATWNKESRTYINFLKRSFTWVLVAMMINPYGPKIITLFIDHLFQLRQESGLIQEWAPSSIESLPFFWSLFLMASVFMVEGYIKGRKGIKFWIPSVLAFAVWGGMYYRNAALFTFVGFPFLVWGFNHFRPKFLWSHWIRYGAIFGWFLCLIPISLHAYMLVQPFPKTLVTWSRFPVGAIQFVRDNNIEGRMFNTYGFGGYIQWALGPERKVFIDGRYIFHPLLKELAQLDKALFTEGREGEWDVYLEKQGVNYAIVEYPAFFVAPLHGERPYNLTNVNAMFPGEKWALVFWDDVGLVFLKRGEKFNALIKKREFRFLRPHNFDQTRYMLSREKVSLNDFRNELRRHREEWGFTVVGDRLRHMVDSAQKRLPH